MIKRTKTMKKLSLILLSAAMIISQTTYNTSAAEESTALLETVDKNINTTIEDSTITDTEEDIIQNDNIENSDFINNDNKVDSDKELPLDEEIDNSQIGNENNYTDEVKDNDTEIKEDNLEIEDETTESNDENQEFIEIEDQFLLMEINRTLGKGDNITTKVTIEEMESLTSLYCSRKGISSLNGLEYAINLTALDIIDNNITDLSPVSKLINLEGIWAGSNNIENITPLSELPKLEVINLGGNNIKDISCLNNVKNLVGIILGDNYIENVSLHGLSNLKSLYLSSNNISKIDLEGLDNLEQLFLDDNNLNDEFKLSNLTKLDMLDLSDNNISDIQLTNIDNLTYLGAVNNNLTSLNVENLKKLDHIFISNNKIKDISSLNELSNLEHLVAKDQRIILDDIQIDHSIYTMNSPIKSVDDTTVRLTPISGTGIFEGSSITYSNLSKGKNELNTSFNAEKVENGKEIYFSGTITQNVIVNENIEYKNNLPIIKASDVNLKVGDKFNPLDYASAEDKEDGDITSKIKVVQNTVDTSKVGTYKVIYEVTDSQGGKTTKEIKVSVKDKVQTLPNTGGASGTGLFGIIITALGFVINKKRV